MQSYIRYKKYYDIKPKPSLYNKQTTATYYNLKQITEDQKNQSATLNGLALA